MSMARLMVRDSGTSIKKNNKCRSFHFRYLELCRAKNITPLPEIRSKNNATSILEFFGDKLSVIEWLLIIEALHYDQVLQTLSIRMRKCLGSVLDHIDSEKKAKLFRQKPIIYSKFVFSGLIEAITNCIEFNKNLRILKLEGLPLKDKYIESIAKALASNENLKEISFQRSYIHDKGCEAVCNTVKYLNNVERINLSECEISTKGAEFVAEMIKMQKISRYTEGWQKSLRYRDVDLDSISGLRSIQLARNPQIGDEGLKAIAEVLKEDAWVKVIDMENCGLTDRGANLVLDCLDLNSAIIEFNISSNEGISKFLQRSIRDHLGKDDDKINDPKYELHGLNGIKTLAKHKKVSIPQLLEHIKTLEEQLEFERTLRKKAEQLNEKLNNQIMAYENENKMEASDNKTKLPDGYVMVRNDSLQSIIKERNDFHKMTSSACSSRNDTPRSTTTTIRYKMANKQEDSQSDISFCESVVEQRKVMKVRKVKSETKYVEPITKDATKKRESKSDHEFANETDFNLNPMVQFETGIGDSVMVSKKHNMMLSTAAGSNQINYATEKMQNNFNGNFNNKIIEIDELSLPSSRGAGDCSSDSDTLRNTVEYPPIKVYMRRKHHQQQQQQQQLQQQQQQQQQTLQQLQQLKELSQGDDNACMMKSPRSLFLGFCDD